MKKLFLILIIILINSGLRAQDLSSDFENQNKERSASTQEINELLYSMFLVLECEGIRYFGIRNDKIVHFQIPLNSQAQSGQLIGTKTDEIQYNPTNNYFTWKQDAIADIKLIYQLNVNQRTLFLKSSASGEIRKSSCEDATSKYRRKPDKKIDHILETTEHIFNCGDRTLIGVNTILKGSPFLVLVDEDQSTRNRSLISLHKLEFLERENKAVSRTRLNIYELIFNPTKEREMEFVTRNIQNAVVSKKSCRAKQ